MDQYDLDYAIVPNLEGRENNCVSRLGSKIYLPLVFDHHDGLWGRKGLHSQWRNSRLLIFSTGLAHPKTRGKGEEPQARRARACRGHHRAHSGLRVP